MEYNAKKLLKKIDDYFAGAISRAALGEWANRAYYDLLKGGYIENEKIVIYPFIKVISTFHLRENDKDDIYPCTEENVKIIQDILHGKRNFDFAVEISIPIQTYSMFKENHYFDEERREIYSKLRDVLVCYFEQKYAISDEMAKQVEAVMCLKHRDEVVLDLLEEYILRFLKVLFKNNFTELGLQKSLKLYAKKSKQNIIADRLISYLDCYIGNRNFQLLITFKDGKSNLVSVVG